MCVYYKMMSFGGRCDPRGSRFYVSKRIVLAVREFGPAGPKSAQFGVNFGPGAKSILGPPPVTSASLYIVPHTTKKDLKNFHFSHIDAFL